MLCPNSKTENQELLTELFENTEKVGLLECQGNGFSSPYLKKRRKY